MGAAAIAVPQAAESPYLGVGLYTVPEAARLLKKASRRVQRWVEGYTFRSTSGPEHHSTPLFVREDAELIERRILTFLDLMELHLICHFLDKGVSLRVIRATAREAARRFHTNHPLAIKRFHTDGKRLIAELEFEPGEGITRRQFYEEIDKGQLVMEDMAKPFFLKLVYEHDLARQYWPLGRERGVVLDPARALGKPIIDRAGVPTRVLYQMLQGSGDSAESVAEWYEVDVRDVEAAVEFETMLEQPA